MEVYIHLPNKTNIRLLVSPTAKIRDLKQMTMTSVGIDVRHLYLVYMAKVLDDDLTMADYMIGNHAYIQFFKGGLKEKEKEPYTRQ